MLIPLAQPPSETFKTNPFNISLVLTCEQAYSQSWRRSLRTRQNNLFLLQKMASIWKQAWKNKLMEMKEEQSNSSFLWCIHQLVNNPN